MIYLYMSWKEKRCYHLPIVYVCPSIWNVALLHFLNNFALKPTGGGTVVGFFDSFDGVDDRDLLGGSDIFMQP